MESAAVETALELDEPVRDTRVEQLFENWNLPYELDQQFPLTRLKIEDAAQIRQEAHRAPKNTVEQYVTHMKHGALFPPIIVGTNAMLVDGNTRVKACQLLNRKTFPAYKVKFPTLESARMVAAAVNQMGGDRLSDDEIIKAAETMMNAGYHDEAIARTLGRSTSHVRNVRRDRTFREAATRTGVEPLKVPKQVARILAGIQHDEPFKAAVELVARANPSTKDASALVAAVEQTRSDADALAVIRAKETEWGPVTGPPPRPRPLNRSRAKKALPHVRALLELGEQAGDLVMPDDAAAADLWLQLNRLSTNVVALYTKP